MWWMRLLNRQGIRLTAGTGPRGPRSFVTRSEAPSATACSSMTSPDCPPSPAPQSRRWYDHARGYTKMKWSHLASKSRWSVAEALTTVTLAARRYGAQGRRSCAGRCSLGVQPRHPRPDPGRRYHRGRWSGSPRPSPSQPWKTQPYCGRYSAHAPAPRPGRAAVATTQRRMRAVLPLACPR